jgi:hypothetical protein
MFVISEEYRQYLPSQAVFKLERWVNEGGDLSGFWWHLLTRDYGSAACNADADNLKSFGWLVRCLEQYLPDDCFGSVEKVKAWKGVL